MKFARRYLINCLEMHFTFPLRLHAHFQKMRRALLYLATSRKQIERSM